MTPKLAAPSRAEITALAMLIPLLIAVPAFADHHGKYKFKGGIVPHAPGVKAISGFIADSSHGAPSPGSAAAYQSGNVDPIMPLIAGIDRNCYVVDADGAGFGFDYSSIVSANQCVSFYDPQLIPKRRPGRDRRGPDVAALGRSALDRAIALAPSPDLQIAPAVKGLTGMPSYFWLGNEVGAISATARAGGVTVTAEASPAAFYWLFGDGHDMLTYHPGRPFVSVDSPGDIAYTYETKDHYTVSAQIIWHARFRVNDGPWRPLGSFTTSDSRPFPVREVIAVLKPGPND